MKSYVVCPCCSNKLIHHISNHRDYWFCRSCWQEMPALKMVVVESIEERDCDRVSPSISNLINPERAKFETI